MLNIARHKEAARSLAWMSLRNKSFKQVRRDQENRIYTSMAEINRIRNIGIIAHIDAGKTTTTERMLYYSGTIENPGEVHHGNTVMDYLEQERKRGITIRAATTSFKWRGLNADDFYQINLIDTPGHVDFTAEVERSLRVCDGAIGIFDAMQGVETQTETVWQQSNRFGIPRLGFINKLDRIGADIETTLDSVRNKLNSVPLLVNIPSGEDASFDGIVDLGTMRHYSYLDDLGKMVEVEDCDKDHFAYEKAMFYRDRLIEDLAEIDDTIADKYLEGEFISHIDINNSLRYCLRTKNSVALHCGSALKNRGIQPLLENVVNLLPSPQDTESISGSDVSTGQKIYRFSNPKDKLCAFAFKVVADPIRGLVTFFRVYSGTLKNRTKIMNSKTGRIEKITQLFRMTADEVTNIEELGVGDIGAITGVHNIRSGDTFIQEDDPERIQLSGVSIPPPVFFCSIEAELSRDQNKLAQVIQDLTYEDPSISVSENRDTGQLQISGMGELHLEILKDRIEIDYGIKAFLGTMRVAYRESVSGKTRHTFTVDTKKAGKSIFAELTLEVEGLEVDHGEAEEVAEAEEYVLDNLSEKTTADSSTQHTDAEKYNKITRDYLKLEKRSERKKVDDDKLIKRGRSREVKGEDFELLRSLDSASAEILLGIEDAINTSLESGQLLGYPIVHTRVRIVDGKWSSLRSDELTFKECAARCMKEIFMKSNKNLLEPYMRTEIQIPEYCLGDIVSNISGKKGGKIISINNVKQKFSDDIDSGRNILKCLLPLSQIVGYSKYLRSVTKGEGTFIMAFSHFQALSEEMQAEVLDNPFF
ncbi:unnamed protein product [Moneuplotes crassus]|uniref:Tr-type G domain-containing protein n=1 Tax=Euplotes crassus TaxID=5936 RepID=A0AAD1Y6M8_EUPCR|nr:unnamed protein product [Moneuplotes crassus]